MKTHADKYQESKSQSVANALSQKQNNVNETFQLADNRSSVVIQQKSISKNTPIEQVATSSTVIQRMPPKYKTHQATAGEAEEKGDLEGAIKAQKKHIKGRAESDAKYQDKGHIDFTEDQKDKLTKLEATKAAEDKRIREEGMKIKGGVPEAISVEKAKEPGSWAKLAKGAGA